MSEDRGGNCRGNCRGDHKKSWNQPPRGIGLLEWMVALGLNALVLLILTQALLGARVSFAMIDAIARLSDNGRFAQDVIAQSLLQAQVTLPCARAMDDPLRIQHNQIRQSRGFVTNASVVGWEAMGTQGPSWSLSPNRTEASSTIADLPPALAGRVDPQSDVLMVHKKTPVSGVMVTELELGQIKTNRGHGLKDCSFVVLSDCTIDQSIQVSHVETRALNWSADSACEPGNASADSLGMGQPSDGSDWNHIALYHWQAVAWFVGVPVAGERTLYRALFDRGQSRVRVEAMVEGIETLQLEYAAHRPGQPMAWQSADAINDWTLVAGVRFGVLASGRLSSQRDASDPLTDQSTAQPLLGAWVSSPKDLGYVKSFQTARALRGSLTGSNF